MAKALELLIYGPIGGVCIFEASGVDAADVAKQLSASKAKLVNVRINSGGGSAFDGMAIYTALKHWHGDVHVHVDGLAASAASIIAMAGDTINISSAGMIMIHSASAGLQGNADELRKQVDVLDKLDGQMAGIYASRTGKEREDVLALMAEETWFTAEEAVAAGLADNVVGAVKVAACADLEAYGYRNAPATLYVTHDGDAASGTIEWSNEPGGPAAATTTTITTTNAPVSAPGKHNEMNIFAEAAGLNEGATEAEIVAKLHNTSIELRAAVKSADVYHAALSKLTAAVGAEGAEALGKIQAGIVALSLVEEQTAKLEAIEAKTELDAHAALVKQGKAEGKLTADLEKLFADKSSSELGAFLAVAPKVVPVQDEKKSVISGSVVAGVRPQHNGKLYADLDNQERLAIHAENPELFQAMSDDYRANLTAAN